jgi:hypothetical protein
VQERAAEAAAASERPAAGGEAPGDRVEDDDAP